MNELAAVEGQKAVQKAVLRKSLHHPRGEIGEATTQPVAPDFCFPL